MNQRVRRRTFLGAAIGALAAPVAAVAAMGEADTTRIAIPPLTRPTQERYWVEKYQLEKVPVVPMLLSALATVNACAFRGCEPGTVMGHNMRVERSGGQGKKGTGCHVWIGFAYRRRGWEPYKKVDLAQLMADAGMDARTRVS